MDRTVDVLWLAPHPDDAEISSAGTILKLVDDGVRVGICDMTRGEMGTRGTPEIRAAESAAAAQLLGVEERINFGLPDAHVAEDEPALRAVVGAVRRLRPQVLLAPWIKDAHPDHEATGRVARRAFFHSGLRRLYPDLGEPHRPRLLVHYLLHDAITPTFCVDIGDYVERKREVVECYATQLARDPSRKGHFLRGVDPLERSETRDRYYGAQCGVRAAEPFFVDGPLPLADFRSVLS